MSDKKENNELNEKEIVEEVSDETAIKNEIEKNEKDKKIEPCTTVVEISSTTTVKDEIDTSKDLMTPTDDDEEQKIILDLVTSLGHESDSEEAEKKIAQDQLEELKTQTSRKRRRKNKNVQQNDMDSDELVAILEGENEGHYEIISVVSEINEEKNKKKNDIDEKVGINQQKWRKRKCVTENSSGNVTASLLKSLSSDWNDDSEKDTVSTKKVKKKGGVNKIEEENIILESNKPRRIIKKKIIWDPDAPETHFPLASLVQTSKPQKQLSKGTPMRSVTPKKADVMKSKIVKPPESKNEETVVVTQKRRIQTPVAINQKKKKISETEKSSDNEISEMKNESENCQVIKTTTTATKREIVTRKKDVPKKENVQNRKVILTKKENVTSPKKETIVMTKRETPTFKKQNLTSALEMAAKKLAKQSMEVDIPLTRKRTPKPKKGNWDYVYNQRNMDSMIIRRRSSSYSSTTSPRRPSLEHTIPSSTVPQTSAKTQATLTDQNVEVIISVTSDTKKESNTKDKGKVENNIVFEFAKPETKSNANKKETDEDITALLSVENYVNKKTLKNARELPRKSVRNSNAAVNNSKNKEVESRMISEGNTVVIKKHGNVTQLIVHPKYDRIKYSYSVQILKSLTKSLHSLSNDGSCKAVVLTAESPHFCQGLDLNYVLNQNAEKRKNASEEMSRAVRDFLKELVCFSKPIIAGVQGTCIGLGVTMLPLFDIVISSDKCTFETTCAKFGQFPEGYCVLSFTSNVRHNFKTKLLWLCEKMNSTEAALSGLITKLTAPERVQEDALSCAKKIAFSSQAFIAMKSQRFKNELSRLLPAINDEEKVLTNHWISAECQEKIKIYLQNECS